MELRKYLMAGGLASVLVLGACGGDTAEEDTTEEETMEEDTMERKRQWRTICSSKKVHRLQKRRLRDTPEPFSMFNSP